MLFPHLLSRHFVVVSMVSILVSACAKEPALVQKPEGAPHPSTSELISIVGDKEMRERPAPVVQHAPRASEEKMEAVRQISPAVASIYGGAAISYDFADEAKKKVDAAHDGRYAPIQENKKQTVKQDSVSTFSIDVDTAAYANVRRFLNAGQLPPAEAVRVEEMVNYFDYQYDMPSSLRGDPFKITTEIAPSPWNAGSYLLHIGVKAYQPTEQLPRNLVFLLDVSGSMDAPNRLALVKQSLRLLVNQLNAQDRVAIVVYAGSSGVVLPSTRGDMHREILGALERLHAGGSTNGEGGIRLAYQIAQQHFIRDGVNRVILATDGDFNVGTTGTEDLVNLVKQKKRSGVGLTVLGVGMGNYNDDMLEKISNSGDGNAAYIDNLQEAQKVLVQQMNATLQTVAKDTKVQIEFNPEHVASYRLIGYENRMLNREDFTDDRVDAGDVGAGHSVTALYEITLSKPLRYQTTKPSESGELAFLKVRYKRPDEHESREMSHAISRNSIQNDLSRTSNNFRFAAAVAAFGQRLRDSEQVGEYSYKQISELARKSRGNDDYGYRSEFLKLVELAGSLDR